jgi:hypothetical protein
MGNNFNTTCVFGGVFLEETVDVVDVVPDEMLVLGVVFKGLIVLFESCSRDTADEAIILGVFLDFLSLVSEF